MEEMDREMCTYLFLDSRERMEKEGRNSDARNKHLLAATRTPPVGDLAHNPACALTENQTRDFSLCGMTPNTLTQSHQSGLVFCFSLVTLGTLQQKVQLTFVDQNHFLLNLTLNNCLFIQLNVLRAPQSCERCRIIMALMRIIPADMELMHKLNRFSWYHYSKRVNSSGYSCV